MKTLTTTTGSFTQPLINTLKGVATILPMLTSSKLGPPSIWLYAKTKVVAVLIITFLIYRAQKRHRVFLLPFRKSNSCWAVCVSADLVLICLRIVSVAGHWMWSMSTPPACTSKPGRRTVSSVKEQQLKPKILPSSSLET